ncbi:MAG: glycerol-3-phosphate dehydrogenase [Deltaproteobacteria bacterium]|nr:glycerol-3-phosphate dehydrogenase [Deltaproteobacteria bacterium]HCH61961.1 glycerol-3-phosphate dehydrogenase [Deltaproteobacteria bacterium]
MRIAVLGAGSWGTALAMQLCRSGDDVWQWDRRADRATEHQLARQNLRYLPGVDYPENLTVSSDMAAVLADATFVVEAIPSPSVRSVMTAALPFMRPDAVVCCASKGIEESTLLTMDEVLEQVLPPKMHARSTFLAGPSFAREVAAGMPTAVVVASRSPLSARAVADAFHGGPFRVYHTDDIVGAELGGALKNIIAIATGIADGVGSGLNARAALITRGLAEITRLAVHRGGNPLTLAGLAGMGDLVLTATGDLSRNRRVGLGLGKGKTLDQVLHELGQVAEGVITTKSARELAAREGVEMPITEQVYQLLYEGKSAQEGLRDLLARDRRAERE